MSPQILGMGGLLLLLAAGCAAAPDTPGPEWYACDSDALGARDDHPGAARYQRLIDAALAHGATAVTAAVLTPEGLWVGAGGMADLAQQIPARPCHRFYIASATKMFSATATLRLVEAGVLGLDDLARDHLPAEVRERVANLDITDPARGVTVRDLLQHTSGIPDYLHMGYYTGAFNLGLAGGSAAEELEWIYGRPALFAPGTDLEYSNANYLLLSLILEAVTGESAYAVLHEQVTAPLGLSETWGRSESPTAVVRGYADLHGDGVLMDHTAMTEAVMSGAGKLDGGLVSVPADVARLLQALVVSREALLPGTLAEMQDFYDYAPGEDEGLEDGYGLGLARIETTAGPGWGHYGTVYPYLTLAFHIPEAEVTVVMSLSGWVEGMDTWVSSAAPLALVLEE